MRDKKTSCSSGRRSTPCRRALQNGSMLIAKGVDRYSVAIYLLRVPNESDLFLPIFPEKLSETVDSAGAKILGDDRPIIIKMKRFDFI